MGKVLDNVLLSASVKIEFKALEIEHLILSFLEVFYKVYKPTTYTLVTKFGIVIGKTDILITGT
jgi:hypothetical protein